VEPFRHPPRSSGEETAMAQRDKPPDLPHRDRKEIEREAEKSRKALDKVPEHGTDPLHEGP
jgi:hypothetical protein